MNELELYIHIPFCVKKCNYCDFVSAPADGLQQSRYISALLNEISAKGIYAKNMTVRSVFIGGGTPSLLDGDYISIIMETVKEHYELAPGAEITIEANPGTLTRQKLDTYLESGINRISIGLQSVNDENLKLLGRIHNFDDFTKCFETAYSEGFENINVDMIYALPDQSLEEWKSELELVSSLPVTHISAYSLILEEGTPLYKHRSQLNFPSDDETAGMYKATAEILEKYGIFRYEISNYAKNGYECRHNIGYWRRIPYLGFGLAAASYFEDERWTNTDSLNEYSSYYEEEKRGLHPEEISRDILRLSRDDKMSEFMILGLRLTEGVSTAGFENEFGCNIYEVFGERIDKHLKIGSLIKEGNILKIPYKYLFVSNSILSDFL